MDMDILALSNLLNSVSENNNPNVVIPDDNGHKNAKSAVTPSSFGAPKTHTQTQRSSSSSQRLENNEKHPLKVDHDAIWNDTTATANDDDDNALETASPTNDDHLPSPPYDIFYKQYVGTQDVFGKTTKTPAVSDCDSLVVKIWFRGATGGLTELDLDVTANKIVARSRQWRLELYLPRPVVRDTGNAKWDPDDEVLTVTLPIDKEDEQVW